MDHKQQDILQRILDYHLGIDAGEQRAQTEELLHNDAQAQSLSEALQRTLRPLHRWTDQEPPQGLTERTLRYIDFHESLSGNRQGDLDEPAELQPATATPGEEDGEKRQRRRWVVGNLRDWIALAACIAIFIGVLQPGLQHARQLAQQRLCAMQLTRISTGVSEYALDHAGYLPSVEHRPNAVWWQVGLQDEEHHSNTRNPYLLVKHGYIPNNQFLCPGVPQLSVESVRELPATIQELRDFPNRNEMHYSYMLTPEPGVRLGVKRRGVVMTDRNPVFAVPEIADMNQLSLEDRPELTETNSPNHNGQGQNVLFMDGSVQFDQNRLLDNTHNDMFLIDNVKTYHGRELPQSDTDVFVAP